jgi:two-component system chemotaxis sensor kinase CheA
VNASDPAETFRLEAQDLLEVLEQALLDLEQTPDDRDLVDTAFRALHTLKGSGAMFGFTKAAGFIHHVETAFDRVRKGTVPPSRELVAVTLAAKDHMRLLIEHPDASDPAREAALLAQLHEVVGGAPAGPATSPAGAAGASSTGTSTSGTSAAGTSATGTSATGTSMVRSSAKPQGKAAARTSSARAGKGAKGSRSSRASSKADGTASAPPSPDGAETARAEVWRIRFRLPADAMATGTNPLRLLDELRELGPTTVTALSSDVPSLEAIDPESCYIAWDVVLSTVRPREAIDDVFMFVLDDMELKVDRIDDTPESHRIGEILVARGDVAPETVGAALAQQERLGQLLVRTGAITEDRLTSALAEQKHLRREAVGGHEPARARGSIRVPAERLDELMDRVGELVIAQARLRQIATGSQDLHIKAVAEEIERLANELRDTTMGIRMVPIGSLFGQFRRLVHDLSRDLGKEVELSTEGEDTELDKTIIDRLNEPLVHLIRNSIDHGLEPPSARLAAGKPRAGRIHLSARHTGAAVSISIRDDGRGLDRARIQARAEEQGLLPPGARPTDSELFQYLFHPGFSTAREVTAVSGRGVGMDVVKRVLEIMRGNIDVDTVPGQWTQMSLRLPLTLAIIDGLLVRVGHGRYVIPLSAVEECVELSVAEEARSHSRCFLNLRGSLVPYLRLRELFSATTPPDPYQKVVVVSSGDLRIGLVVDQVIGDHQTVIKSLSRLHADVETFSGATILGDGTVALILDVGHLVEFGQIREGHLKAS